MFAAIDLRGMMQLPVPLNEIIGRERELADLQIMLASRRLVTITGTGGVGKTRVAIALAHKLAPSFSDGAAFVDLAPITGPDLIVPAIAQTFDIREFGRHSVIDLLRTYLGRKQLLLVLDNFEQILAGATIVSDLLQHAPGLSIVVTSRARLRIAGEVEYPLGPLQVPDVDASANPAALAQYPASVLFVQRARDVAPHFALNAANAPAVADICRRLDGLPLAIELAAARVKLMPPQAMLQRMTVTLPLLTSGPRDLPSRQQTLRATINWSEQLLGDDERVLFRRLSVFRVGWTLDAAEAVAGEGLDALAALEGLIDQSLVVQREQRDGSARFRLLEPIREFAAGRLDEAGEVEVIRRRHALYFASLVSDLYRQLNGPDGPAWFERTATEYDNLRTALSWLLVAGEVEPGMLMMSQLLPFWAHRGYTREGRAQVEAFLAHADANCPSVGRVSALFALGFLRTLHEPGWSGVLSLGDESYAIAEALGDRQALAWALQLRGRFNAQHGDAALARADLARMVAVSRDMENNADVVRAMLDRVFLEFNEGAVDEALRSLDEALSIARAGNHHIVMALTLWAIAKSHAMLGHQALAIDYYRQALSVMRDFDGWSTIVRTLDDVVRLLVKETATVRAVQLLGMVSLLRERVDAGQPFEGDAMTDLLPTLREALPDEDFEAAWAVGTAMTLDDVIAGTWPEPTATDAARAITPQPALHLVTRREQEVLRLLVEGKSDREIAADLFISHHTVMRHVSHILAKLGVESRTAAATLAVRDDLI